MAGKYSKSWEAELHSVADVIDSSNKSLALFGMSDKKFSPRSYGFLLAGKKPEIFPVMLQSLYDLLKEELGYETEWKSVSLGEKYQLFAEACNQLSEFIKNDSIEQTVNGITINSQYPALDGQDFIYSIQSHYKAKQPKKITNNSIDTNNTEDSLADNLKKIIAVYSEESKNEFKENSLTKSITKKYLN